MSKNTQNADRRNAAIAEAKAEQAKRLANNPEAGQPTAQAIIDAIAKLPVIERGAPPPAGQAIPFILTDYEPMTAKGTKAITGYRLYYARVIEHNEVKYNLPTVVTVPNTFLDNYLSLVLFHISGFYPTTADLLKAMLGQPIPHILTANGQHLNWLPSVPTDYTL